MVQGKGGCPKERDGLITEEYLDFLGIPETEEEKDRESNPSKKNLNEMSTTRQRALVITGSGYRAWMEEKKAKVLAAQTAAATKVSLNALNKATKLREAAQKALRSQLKEEREAKIRLCMGTLTSPAPRPQAAVPSDVQCVLHGMWRGKWKELGLNDPWTQCRVCDQWFCPVCGNREKV